MSQVRRILRILASALTILSLLHCLAVATLWARSRFVMDRIWFRARLNDSSGQKPSFLILQSGKGGIGFTYGRIRPSSSYEDFVHVSSPPQYPNEWDNVAEGSFHWKNEHTSANPLFTGAVSCSVPYWVPFSATLPFASLAARRIALRHRTRRRLAANLCPRCAYDLRATPDRCPNAAQSRQTPHHPPNREQRRSGHHRDRGRRGEKSEL